MIPESGFWNLKFVVWNSNASEDSLLQVYSLLTFLTAESDSVEGCYA